MYEHVTLLRPAAPSPDARRTSTALPLDLLEQVRGRLRLLAALLLIAFGFDLVVFALNCAAAFLQHRPLPAELVATRGFQWVNLGAALASLGLWWAARSERVSAARLHTLGLAYEIAICFTIATITFWPYYLKNHIVPDLTWVPAVVILFPLIMPGPPRRMLAAAIAAGAMSPLALLLLELSGKVAAGPEDYVKSTVGPGFGVVFAYMGARVVYGLGRAVATARELGSYRLEARLGQGGMGEVWRARHRMLARPAAIKVIRPAPSALPAGEGGPVRQSGEAVRRFEREAQAIASLRSPHTVNLFDFGIADDGAFYYAMELLDGLDTDQLVRRFGPLPAERAIYVLRQVCHSLSEAQARGLVHRDIKPANIFLCRYGEDHDFVKVLDFGLVRAVSEPAEGEALRLTGESVVPGTPAFIAPEQALGQRVLDGRVDIYATGCVAYWLLTGQLVFNAATALDMIVQHAHTPPTPPSTRSELPIPPAFDQLVLSCLAKDPDARPQSARQLLERLDEVGGPQAWSRERAREWWELHLPAQASA